jgi:hypothetical protein
MAGTAVVLRPLTEVPHDPPTLDAGTGRRRVSGSGHQRSGHAPCAWHVVSRIGTRERGRSCVPCPHGVMDVATTRNTRSFRQVRSTLGRRTLVSTLLGALVLPLRAMRRAATAGEPGPVPPKCSKLGGTCFVNSDCCGPGTRCKRAGRNQCRCQANRAKCGPVCCPIGQACCDQCADLQTDANNCGTCFTVCGADQTCIAGSCTS